MDLNWLDLHIYYLSRNKITIIDDNLKISEYKYLY